MLQRANSKLQRLKSLNGWVVASNSRPRMAWDYFIAILSLYVAFEVSFVVAFQAEPVGGAVAFDSLLDFLFCLDIVLILLTSRKDEWGEETLNPRPYLRGERRVACWFPLKDAVGCRLQGIGACCDRDAMRRRRGLRFTLFFLQPYSPGWFTVDLVSALPLNLLTSSRIVHLIKLLRITRIIRIFHQIVSANSK